MGVVSLAVVGLQIVIFATIRIASRFGSGAMWFVALLWALFTIGGAVATGGLIALQLFTIIFALAGGSKSSK